MGFRWPPNPWKCNPALRGLTPRERGEIERQLLGWVTNGADPVGLAVFAAPSCIMILVAVILPEPSSVTGKACWLVGFILSYWLVFAVVRRRLVKKFLKRVRCEACGGGFVQSRPGAMACENGHWTGLDELWPVRHPPPPLHWRLGPLRVTSRREHRRYRELAPFDEGNAAVLFDQAKTWSSAALGRAMVMSWVVGYSTAAASMIVGMGVGMLIGRVIGQSARRGDALITTIAGIAFVMGAIAGIAAGRGVWRRAVRAAITRRLSTSICGCCCYSLKEIPREPGGVRCPECGAFTPFIPRAQQPAS